MSLKIKEVAQRLSGVKIIIHRFFKLHPEGFEDLTRIFYRGHTPTLTLPPREGGEGRGLWQRRRSRISPGRQSLKISLNVRIFPRDLDIFRDWRPEAIRLFLLSSHYRS